MIVWVPCVLVGVWATTSLVPAKPPLPQNPNAILPFLVKTQTTPVLGGLLTAGILAAIMSSLDSQFLCIGTIFSNDVVNHYRSEPLSDRAQVLTTRGFIIGIVLITYLLSLSNRSSVFALAVWCFSGFSSLFPLIFAAVYWKRLTKAARTPVCWPRRVCGDICSTSRDSAPTGRTRYISRWARTPTRSCRWPRSLPLRLWRWSSAHWQPARPLRTRLRSSFLSGDSPWFCLALRGNAAATLPYPPLPSVLRGRYP